MRHINIIPEIEIPAHCTAALVSYPEFGCGNADDLAHYNLDLTHFGFTLFSIANSWPFFTNVLNEVCDLFPSPYIHCGGDEVIATGAEGVANVVQEPRFRRVPARRAPR